MSLPRKKPTPHTWTKREEDYIGVDGDARPETVFVCQVCDMRINMQGTWEGDQPPDTALEMWRKTEDCDEELVKKVMER